MTTFIENVFQNQVANFSNTKTAIMLHQPNKLYSPHNELVA